MQFSAIFVALFATSALAQAGGKCFDAGDCLIQGGGQCVHTAKGLGGIMGTCIKSGAAAPTATGGSTGGSSGSICFDDGDCIFSSGGHKCVRGAKGGITGTCQAA